MAYIKKLVQKPSIKITDIERDHENRVYRYQGSIYVFMYRKYTQTDI